MRGGGRGRKERTMEKCEGGVKIKGIKDTGVLD